MDPELKKLLEENLKVSQETNVLLKDMKRRALWAMWGKIVFWVVVIILPLFFLPYFFQQYLNTLQSALSGGGGDTTNYNIGDFQKLLGN
jgi:hypothetical protein